MTLAFNIEFRKASDAASRLTKDHALAAEIAGLVAHSVMDEREACAKIADEGAHYGTAEGAEDMANTIGRLIRARSNEK